MADRSPRSRQRKTVKITDPEPRRWSPVPVEQAGDPVKARSPPKTQTEQSPPRLRESSSESLVSPSRLKKQQSLERRRSSSPPAISGAVTEHRYPPAAAVRTVELQPPAPPCPTILDIEDDEMGEDPIKGSRSPSGCSPRASLVGGGGQHKLVNCATSPFAPLSPRNAATSPMRRSFSPGRDQEGGRPLDIERGTLDRPYTDQQLKERLESLITGGSYPFAKIVQKSYAITESEAQEGQGKETVWVRADDPSTVTGQFEDSTALRKAAMELELKLKRYQSQIGVSPSRQDHGGGYTGYTALLLQSVSAILVHLAEQEAAGGVSSHPDIGPDLIDTMAALQTTVETLSVELLSCRRELAESQQALSSLQQEHGTTINFLLANCLLKDGATLKRGEDLMTFTPDTTEAPLISLTPEQPARSETTSTTRTTVVPSHRTEQSGISHAPVNGCSSSELSKDNWTTDTSEPIPGTTPGDQEASFHSCTQDDTLLTSLDSPPHPNMTSSSAPNMVSTLTPGSAPNTTLDSGGHADSSSSDQLDLSQDLDALIARLRQMNSLASRTADSTASPSLILEATPNLFENSLSSSTSPNIPSPPTVLRTASSTHQIGSAFSPALRRGDQERSSTRRSENGVHSGRSPRKSSPKRELSPAKRSPPRREVSPPKQTEPRSPPKPTEPRSPPKQTLPRSPPKPTEPISPAKPTEVNSHSKTTEHRSRSPQKPTYAKPHHRSPVKEQSPQRPKETFPKPMMKPIRTTELPVKETPQVNETLQAAPAAKEVDQSLEGLTRPPSESETRDLIVRFLNNNPHYVQHLDSTEAPSPGSVSSVIEQFERRSASSPEKGPSPLFKAANSPVKKLPTKESAVAVEQTKGKVLENSENNLKTGGGSSELLGTLLSLNDAKLTELVNTLTELTDGR